MSSIHAAIVLSMLAAPVRAQEKAAPFDAPLVTLPMTDRYGLLVDLDNDGFMDAVSWWWTSGYAGDVRLTGWRNNRHGKLVQAWTTLVDLSSTAPPASFAKLRLRSCNVDSDGSTDFYFEMTGYQWASIRVLRSRGLQTPELVPAYSVSYVIQGAPPDIHGVVADFTGDGQADLAYALLGSLRLLEFVPGQPSLQLRSQTSPFGSIEGLMPIDANGDATPDLLAWSGTTIKMISVQACLPTATFTFSQGIADHHMPATGDIDRDGDEDLVIWDMSRYVVLRRGGAASWSVEPPVTGGPAEFLVDVDQDGDLDGACCGGGSEDPLYNLLPSTMRLSLNDGTGSFAPAIETSWLGSDHLGGIADLDHDGDLDVVAGRCILYARGPLTDVLRPPLGGAPATERSTADLDGDSDPDFAVGLRTMERNLGEGACSEFEASFPSATPVGTTFVGPGWPGDFDGDGDLDLVVKHFAGPTLLGQRLLVNLGGGAFADGGPAGASGVDFNAGVNHGDVPEASLAADADGDGDIDLITRSHVPSSQSASRVWWNGGAGTFTAGPEFLGECIHQVADLTGDGIPELAAVTNAVGWHAGLGGGAFGPHVALETLDPHRDRFALADLDADGDLDFAIVTSKPWLQLYWNDGAGGFTNESETLVGFLPNLQSPRRVWSTDVDGDGLLDLLITPATRETNGVRILKRRPDNSGWQDPFSQIVFEHSGTSGLPLDAVLRDVDGDGDLDFLTDRLTRNGTHSSPEGGRRVQLETGTPGTGGLVPTLGAEGPFRVGESAELRIRGGVGGASGVLTIFAVDDSGGPRSAERAWNAPSQGALYRIPFTLSGTPGTPGTGSWTLPYTVQWEALGQTRRYVATLSDPGAPGGVARTNGLLLSYGL